jgi:hypothetical protein
LCDASIEDIINGKEAVAYRQGLIEGKLLPDCATCPDRPVGDTDELIDLVTKFLQTGEIEIT